MQRIGLKSKLIIAVMGMGLLFSIESAVPRSLNSQGVPSSDLDYVSPEDLLENPKHKVHYAFGRSETSKISMRFSDALVGTTTGVDVETSSGLSALSKEKLNEYAKFYVAFRNGKINSVAKGRFFAQCIAAPTENPFCIFLDEKWKDNLKQFSLTRTSLDPATKELPEIPKGKYVSSRSLASQIRKGNPKAFEKVYRSSIYRGLRKIKSWKAMKRFTNNALDMSACLSPSFYTAVALKIEEYFPDKKLRDKAIKMYQKGVNCVSEELGVWDGKKSQEMIALGRLRLGLLHVWEDRCDLADAHFKYVAEEDESFTTRGLYWRGFCKKQMGDKLGFKILKRKLVKHNPLGYHSIVASDGNLQEIIDLLFSGDSMVYFRSQRRPELNVFVRSIELLLSIKGGNRAAQNIVRFLMRNIKGAESPFQLYVGILASRVEAPIAMFRSLASAFQGNPKLISSEPLKRFFPIKFFKYLNRQKRRVDPYFLAALIRQESGFVPYARSGAGALGLMQLMPATARRFGRVSKRQILKPWVNVRLGAKYLKILLRKWDNDAELTLASYNAGPHRVKQWLRRYPVDNRMLFLDMIPFTETRDYVSLIGRNYYWYLHLYDPGALNPVYSQGRAPASSSRAKNRAEFSGFQIYN